VSYRLSGDEYNLLPHFWPKSASYENHDEKTVFQLADLPHTWSKKIFFSVTIDIFVRYSIPEKEIGPSPI